MRRSSAEGGSPSDAGDHPHRIAGLDAAEDGRGERDTVDKAVMWNLLTMTGADWTLGSVLRPYCHAATVTLTGYWVFGGTGVK